MKAFERFFFSTEKQQRNTRGENCTGQQKRKRKNPFLVFFNKRVMNEEKKRGGKELKQEHQKKPMILCTKGGFPKEQEGFFYLCDLFIYYFPTISFKKKKERGNEKTLFV